MNPKSSLFYTDQDLCYADVLPPFAARARIEVAVLKFLRILNSPTPAISNLNLINRNARNSHFRHGIVAGVSSVFLSHAFCTKSLMKAKDVRAFIRVWKVMEICFKILLEEKQVTQRELFYKLLSDAPDYFKSQAQVNQTVQDVVSLLQCSRMSLGVMASSRGAAIGRLLIQEPNQEIVECSLLGSAGYSISGNLNLLNELVFQSDARYIIVVEKDAVFQRLADDHIYNQIPVILITAKGYPDLATRFLLHKLSMTFPSISIFGLVDWNPAGLAILFTYKFGSIRMGLESYRYACNIKWLGMRHTDLDLIHSNSFIPLTQRDLQVARSLQSFQMLQEAYREELKLMIERGLRAELEALYHNGLDFIGKYVIKKILQADYI